MKLNFFAQILIIFILLPSNYISSQMSLIDYNLKDSKQFKLPHHLREISGLAASDDGRIFCHDDEKGIIYQINPLNGKVVKKFAVGNPIPNRDFEGIAIVKDKFYRERPVYVFQFVTVSNNIEGLCYDPLTNSMLLACKGYPGKKYKGYRSVYSFDLKEKKLMPDPRFLLSLKELDKRYGMKNFSPSAIEYNSKTGTFFILSSHVKALIEVSSDGKVIHGALLSGRNHKQPEGITFTSDIKMLISDEGRGGQGTITVYKLKE